MKKKLVTFIDKQNAEIYTKTIRMTWRTVRNLQEIRKELKKAIARAKSQWVEKLCANINHQHGTMNYWDSIKLLKRSVTKPPPTKQMMMTKEDSSKC